MTRSARGGELLEGLGAHGVEADVLDEASLRRTFGGADAVVNLLTHVPSPNRMADPSAWEENDRLRGEASAAIARAAHGAGVRRLVRESIAFVYADGSDAWLDEDAPVAGGGVATAPLTAERNARELFDGDTVVLRFGLFIGPGTESTLAALETARGGRSIAPGPPGAYRPTLWLDDAAAAISAAQGVPAETYSVADTDPSTNAEIDAALAAAVGVEALRPRAPQDGPLARSQRVSSGRLREVCGWVPRVRAREWPARTATRLHAGARARSSTRERAHRNGAHPRGGHRLGRHRASGVAVAIETKTRTYRTHHPAHRPRAGRVAVTTASAMVPLLGAAGALHRPRSRRGAPGAGRANRVVGSHRESAARHDVKLRQPQRLDPTAGFTRW